MPSPSVPPSSPPPRPLRDAFGERLDALAEAWDEHHLLWYALWASCCTLFASAVFYGYLMVQTRGVWSAPLDDVFIHFDYARSFARGYPFQWSEGNGYSSGNTSLTYPLVLGLGYWIGFRGLSLMAWAGVIANAGVFNFLYQSGRLVDGLPRPDAAPAGRWIKFLVPPAVLSMGALDWTLFSGMENAWHLGMWGVLAASAMRQWRAGDATRSRRRAWWTGLSGALVVASRPESVVCVAAFGLFGAWRARRQGLAPSWRRCLPWVMATAIPGMLLLVVHGGANLLFTGEWSANGAIAKVLLDNPYLSGAEKWQRYRELLDYIVDRLTKHHFAEHRWWGWLAVWVAAVPLCFARRRPLALLLWGQLAGWLLLVSLNNQLRWHNARYAMPAVAWLLVLAAAGLGELFARGGLSTAPVAGEGHAGRWWVRSWPARLVLGCAVVAVYWSHQAPRMHDQVWFFGRAARNIFDQHVTAGMTLRSLGPRRILVGDAGALTYTSDRPGLDLIGLGGFHDYPFARSGVHGLGASLELIERMPVSERPDMMALYPGWWGDLPIFFGRYLAAVPVPGNVICGGAEKVLYQADWRALDRQGKPRELRQGELVVDQLDAGDLVSERAHPLNLPRPSTGFVRYRVLADPAQPDRDLFDAGRIVPGGQSLRTRLRARRGGGRLLLRLAPDEPTRIDVSVGGKKLAVVRLEPRVGAWQEVAVRLPREARGLLDIELGSAVDWVCYHAWVVEHGP